MMGQGAHERSMQSPRDAGAATVGVFILSRRRRQTLRGRQAAGAEIVDPPKTVEYGGTYSAVDPKRHPWFFTAPKAC